ncbi:MAG: hypothetical protein M1155_01500, partial [Patescibacteria group bacterium]|nr:hypothetical protein [Patescibacteria group bacterium]
YINYSEAVDNCGVVQPAVQGTLSCQQNYLCDSTLNKCVPDPSFCTKDYVLNNLCKGYNCGSPIDLCGNSPWSCGSCSSKQGTCKVYAGGGGICGGN